MAAVLYSISMISTNRLIKAGKKEGIYPVNVIADTKTKLRAYRSSELFGNPYIYLRNKCGGIFSFADGELAKHLQKCFQCFCMK